MAITVNGTTIPTALGNIIVNSIKVEKVVCNGTTVWECSGDYYAYQNGVANTSRGITNPTITSEKSGSEGKYTDAVISTYSNSIGVYATDLYADDGASWNGPEILCRTPKIPVLENSKFIAEFICGYQSGTGVLTNWKRIYGVSSDGTETLLNSFVGNSGYFSSSPSELTSTVSSGEISVSGYSYVIIEIYIQSYGSNQYTSGPLSNRDTFCGIVNARLYT